MKCPICDLVQSGAPPECRECGFRFGTYRAPNDEEESVGRAAKTFIARRYVAPVCLLGAVALATAFARPGFRAAGASGTESDGFLEHATLIQMCIDSQRQSGIDDELARESCLRQAREKKRIEQSSEERASAIPLVAASEVQRVELVLQAINPSPNGENTRIRVDPRLVLYDRQGRSVAAEGTVELSLTPESCASLPDIPDLQQSSFRRAKIGRSKVPVAFSQLPSISVAPEATDVSEVELTVTFQGTLQAHAVLPLDDSAQ